MSLKWHNKIGHFVDFVTQFGENTVDANSSSRSWVSVFDWVFLFFFSCLWFVLEQRPIHIFFLFPEHVDLLCLSPANHYHFSDLSSYQLQTGTSGASAPNWSAKDSDRDQATV